MITMLRQDDGMPAIIRSIRGRREPVRPILIALLSLCAVFMFVDARIPPIIIWDESRLAVNALEMHLHGLSLVTTYGLAPDLWNTKPPLMIWLMALSADLFGPSELALRFPAMLAGVATLAIVFVFVRRITLQVWPAAVAVLLLVTSVGFYGEHGARTGDYDALLCLFTTGYTCVLFAAVHRRRPRWRLLLAAASLIAGATMTKSIAGLLPGVGVFIYLLVSRRIGRVLVNGRYMAVLLLALVPIGLFLAAREAAGAGYVQAMWHNDIAGRSGVPIEGHSGWPWYYFGLIFVDGLFSVGVLALLAPLALATAGGRSRPALIFALCCIVGEVIPISASATKLPQYALPALPWIAVACAIALHATLPLIATHHRARWLVGGLLLAAGVPIFSAVAQVRYGLLARREFYPQAGYGALLSALHARRVPRVILIDPGINVAGIDHYTPQLDFYATLWRSRGLMISKRISLPESGYASDATALASCDPGVARALLARGGKPVGGAGAPCFDAAMLILRSRHVRYGAASPHVVALPR